MEDHYYTLGVNRNADHEKIRKAYRDCCKKYHPDLCEGGEQSFKNIQRAYDVLSDEGKKEAYDRKLKGDNAPPTPRPGRGGEHPADFRHNSIFNGLFPGRKRRLALDLLLSRYEAGAGGIFQIPVSVPGHKERTVNLQLRGPVPPGSRFTIPLYDAGLPGYTLTVDIVVE
jgi:DnaJ-class molecular chaperone